MVERYKTLITTKLMKLFCAIPALRFETTYTKPDRISNESQMIKSRDITVKTGRAYEIKVSDERVVLLTKPRIKINEMKTMKKRKKRVNTETSFLKALK